MSGSIKDGGPAFPTDMFGVNVAPEDSGMSLRDWFAGQAMAAFISASKMNGSDTALTAYAFADAMLDEREET